MVEANKKRIIEINQLSFSILHQFFKYENVDIYPRVSINNLRQFRCLSNPGNDPILCKKAFSIWLLFITGKNFSIYVRVFHYSSLMSPLRNSDTIASDNDIRKKNAKSKTFHF